MHNYGVLTKSTTPIDLTASILLAYEKRNKNQSVCVNWIVEKIAPKLVLEQLKNYADSFEIPINVFRQEEISLLNPSRYELEVFLGSLCDTYIESQYQRIRIHHGSIQIRKDGNEINYRYFKKNKSGEIILYENNTVPCSLSQINNNSIYLVGSINLCYLIKSFELVHLPWYCLDSGIYPLIAEEIISPPEGCSNYRFKKSAKKLTPLGYSIHDYFTSNNTINFGDLDFFLHSIDSTTKSRRTKRTNLNNNFFMEVIKNLKEDLWGNMFFSTNSLVDIYISTLKLSRICKLANSFSLCDNENLYFSTTNELKKYCVCKAVLIDKMIRMSVTSTISTYDYNYISLPQIGNIMKERAIIILEYLMKHYYYDDKASIPNLLSCCDPTEINHIFQLFLQIRGNNCTQMVKGSVFDYETICTSMDNR